MISIVKLLIDKQQQQISAEQPSRHKHNKAIDANDGYNFDTAHSDRCETS